MPLQQAFLHRTRITFRRHILILLAADPSNA